MEGPVKWKPSEKRISRPSRPGYTPFRRAGSPRLKGRLEACNCFGGADLLARVSYLA